MSAEEDSRSSSSTQLATLALALSRHSALPSSKLIAVALSSAIADVARNRDWAVFKQALAQVKADPLALETMLTTGHLVVSQVNVSQLRASADSIVELVAVPVVLEPDFEVQVSTVAYREAMQRVLESSGRGISSVRIGDVLLSEAEAFASPQRAQKLMDRLLQGDSIASLRASRTGESAGGRARVALRFVPGVLIQDKQATPERGKLAGERRAKLAQIAGARLATEVHGARVRFGDLSRWTEARREGHALYQAVKVELELARACHRLGIALNDLRVHVHAAESPCSLTICFSRKGRDMPFLQRRFLSWSEAYCTDLVRELGQVAFANGMTICGDERTAPLLEACMLLSASPRTVQGLVAEGRCFEGPEINVPQ